MRNAEASVAEALALPTEAVTSPAETVAGFLSGQRANAPDELACAIPLAKYAIRSQDSRISLQGQCGASLTPGSTCAP